MRWIKHILFLVLSFTVLLTTTHPQQISAFFPSLLIVGSTFESNVDSYVELRHDIPSDFQYLTQIDSSVVNLDFTNSYFQASELELNEESETQENQEIEIEVLATEPETEDENTEEVSEVTTPEATQSADEVEEESIPSPEPTVEPTPEPVSIPEYTLDEPIHEMFQRWADHFNVDKELLHHIAQCESGHNHAALSGNGLYGGMFQFSESTWISTRNQMSHDPNPDLRFHPEESVKTAAFKIAAGGERAWPNCLP